MLIDFNLDYGAEKLGLGSRSCLLFESSIFSLDKHDPDFARDYNDSSDCLINLRTERILKENKFYSEVNRKTKQFSNYQLFFLLRTGTK